MKLSQYKFIFYAVIVLVLILIFTLVFSSSSTDIKNDLKLELIKNLIQLILIVIVGGIIIQTHNQSRDLAKKGKESFNKTISYSIFEKQMQDLIDVQLEYERYVEYVEWLSKNDIFDNNSAADKLKTYLGEIEEYLNSICEFYQESNSEMKEISISKSNKLNDFIYNTNIFKAKFKDYHIYVDILLEETLIS